MLRLVWVGPGLRAAEALPPHVARLVLACVLKIRGQMSSPRAFTTLKLSREGGKRGAEAMITWHFI